MPFHRDSAFDPRGARMAAQDVVSGERLLSLTERTRVTRQQLPGTGGSIVCKQPLGADAARRLRHEQAMLQRLAGVPGIVRLHPSETTASVLALHDDAGMPLSQRLADGPMPAATLVTLARQLAGIVAAMHRAGVVHRDINPDNILLAGAAQAPVLIDFDLASSVAGAQPQFTHASEIAGTLAYLAPEQTGRTGRVLDQRADLYALGATLYEAATGCPPFEGSDALQLVHDHLVRIPLPPIERTPGVPQALSDIVMRLLEKEPDRRYQSAEGLASDLDRLAERLAAGDGNSFALGAHDFAPRLAAPSRLIGRAHELAALREAMAQALGPHPRGVLLTGAPGAGKTALANELRSMASERGGWFVAGRFDPHRRNPHSAPIQALRMLGRLLLAEPETRLAPLRTRLLERLGANAGLTAQFLPEFAILLGVVPVPPTGDPLQTEQRMLQAALDLLGAVVSPARPLVMLLDDLQWAGSLTMRMVDALFGAWAIPGLLLAAAFRDAEVGPAHPLATMRPRWLRLEAPPMQLHLADLPGEALAALIAAMLRLPEAEAARLAVVIAERTGGNPFDTVELLNALRHDGVLVSAGEGWQWDEGAIRRHVGRSNVVDLLTARIERLPHESGELLALLACLGSEVSLGLLEAASGLGAEVLRARLAPALDDGLVTLDESDRGAAVSFRHDRVREAAYRLQGAAGRLRRHLGAARRLAAQPAYAAAAAAQYLPATDAVVDAGEREAVARLFREAAAQARRAATYDAEERLLRAALELLHRPPPVAAGNDGAVELRIAHHTALYSLARHDEADDAFEWVRAHCDDPVRLVDATCVQINSLINRARQREAQELGFALLERLGLPVPLHGFDTEKRAMVQALYAWIASDDKQRDLSRPEPADPRVRGAAKLLHYTMGPTFYCGDPRGALLVLYCHHLWVTHGPCASLLTGFGGMPMLTMNLKDFRSGMVAVRHALAVGEARGYEPETSWVRHCGALFVRHWTEPLDGTPAQAQKARAGLLRGGDLQYACFSYHAELAAQLDSAATLGDIEATVEEADAFAARTGNHFFAQVIVQFRALIDGLHGDTPGALLDPAATPPDPATADVNPTAVHSFYLVRAIAAALLGDAPALQRHATAGMALQRYVLGYYQWAQMQWLHGLALAQQARAAPDQLRGELLAQLGSCHDWLARRAADAPANFGHLASWLQAEDAWSAGELLAAARHFDTALRQLPPQRPWHAALLAERAALCHVDAGLERGARPLLAEARGLYAAWGATAKLRLIDQQHPALRAGAPLAAPRPATTSSVSTDAIEMVAVLRASQALSSETSLTRLEARVGELLGAMTGADTVQLALRGESGDDWFIGVDAGGETSRLPVDDAGARGLLPLSAFRYAQRTGEPLLVEDATQDDRFARDPHFAGMERCSLLAVPIANHGVLRAMLLLENRHSRAAFSAQRLDAVTLIAGQLAVSLDNALLYDSLERKVAERTEALAAANRQLAELSITDKLTGLPNRRRFDDTLQYEWLRALRSGDSIGLAMMDVDQFKAYNDHYGHVRGDACLRRVAEALRDAARRGELVARYGGEEFVAVLSASDLAGARAAAERLRAAVAALHEPHEASTHREVTISIGVVAFVPEASASLATYLEQADKALYEAKRQGRNRVCEATQPDGAGAASAHRPG